MVKALGWVSLGIVVVAAGFLYRYESLDPCEWMTQEVAENAGLLSMKGLGSTANIVMSKQECLETWMDIRVEEAEK